MDEQIRMLFTTELSLPSLVRNYETHELQVRQEAKPMPYLLKMDTFRNRGAYRSGSSDVNGALVISFFAYISSSSAAVDQSGAC
jgi:hypothetical protein